MDIPDFSLIAHIIGACWLIGLAFIIFSGKFKIAGTLGKIIIITGIALMLFYISVLWVKLERPPMRTLGETRLWYSLFLALIGIIIFIRWQKKWHWLIGLALLVFCIPMAELFLYINLKHPENFDKTLMPALQSPWFVPHVIVYMFGYSILGMATIVAIIGLIIYYLGKSEYLVISMADNLVYIGFGFLTFGLLFGALWAKVAWGHYWTWDPKETWAFVTWLMYLIYIHYRFHKPKNILMPLWTLSLAFIILLIAWFGINFLPSAQNSVHVYGN